MKEQLIEYNTAKLAKEKGFNEFTKYLFFDGKEGETNTKTCNTNFHSSRYFSAPAQCLLQKWLREKHKIFISIWLHPHHKENTQEGYSSGVQSINSKNQGEILLDGFTIYSTYEEALEEGLYEALKLIKT